ncbi:FIST C-terminal domain-containing protein [Comamonas sp. Y33R10-2]|uniref:FIST signal transduction protein n=1 Tax=Comamonas sp. Y33R10-2 TaxID=2853257 RepID=UPI001C5CB688|nr:FIST N-terminal domain-containing protein [Comamonas sp. Y33R10-2]QXZ08971.1 FIST C-terminal domain-containing protein [Comamonas sp. Y33R10-2]
MTLFPVAHASDPNWRSAAEQVVQQLRSQLLRLSPQQKQPHRLGLVYVSQSLAPHAQHLLALLARELPQVTDWAGSSGHAVLAMEHEYTEDSSLAVMLLDVPAAHYRVYSGVAPLTTLGAEAGFEAHSALVHSSIDQTDLAELLLELSERTTSGNLFGALSGDDGVQFACRAEDLQRLRADAAVGVFHAGFSGVAFDREVGCFSRVAQGCAPLGAGIEITQAKGPVVLELDGEPALPRLLQLLDVEASPSAGGGWQAALSELRKTQAAIAPLGRGLERGALTDEAQVLHIVGLDPVRQGIALSAAVEVDNTVIFCQRQGHAARHELLQMGAALKDALQPDFADLEPQNFAELTDQLHIRGAIYMSSKGRGSELFGDDDAELKLLRHALGPVPLIGLVAEAQLMDAHVHQLAGVLTVFTGR